MKLDTVVNRRHKTSVPHHTNSDWMQRAFSSLSGNDRTLHHAVFFFSLQPAGFRRPDIPLSNRNFTSLCLSSTPLYFWVSSARSSKKPGRTKNPATKRLLDFFGAANAIRTRDLVLTKDVLCQLSHSSGIGDSERDRTVDL